MRRHFPIFTLLFVISWHSVSISKAQEPAPIGRLGKLGGAYSSASGINSNGVVVGESEDAQGRIRAMRWRLHDDPRMTDLRTLGGMNSSAYAVNIHGVIVGRAQQPNGKFHAVYWTPELIIHDIGSIGGAATNSAAYGVNDAGKIVGMTELSASVGRAFVWDSTQGMRLIETLSGGSSNSATAINAHGHIAGTSQVQGGAQHAFLYANGTLTDLGTLGGANSYAHGINDHGVVVGVAQRADGKQRAFSWQNGVMVDLGTWGDDDISNAYAVDNSGRIVGSSYNTVTRELHALLWDLTLPVNQQKEYLGGSSRSSRASAINSNGAVAGFLTTDAGTSEACQWHATFAHQIISPMPRENIVNKPIVFNELIGLTVAGSSMSLDQLGRPIVRPFRWTEAMGFVVPPLPYRNHITVSLNNFNEVVGMTNDINPTTVRAFLWKPQDNSVTPLATPLGVVSQANSSNDGGDVVGAINAQASLWNQATLDNPVFLGTLGGASSVALSINNFRQVVGYSTTALNQSRAFIWNEEQGMQEIPVNTSENTFALKINDGKRQVLGRIGTSLAGASSSFVWTPPTNLSGSAMKMLPGRANDINFHGDVVGSNVTFGNPLSSCYIWDGEVTLDIRTLIKYPLPASANLTAASAINGDRAVACIGYQDTIGNIYLLRADITGGTGRAIGSISPRASIIPPNAKVSASVQVNAFGGVTVARLYSSHTNALTLPDSVIIENQIGTFTITSHPVENPTEVTIRAEALNSDRSATVTVVPGQPNVFGHIQMQGMGNAFQPLQFRCRNVGNGEEFILTLTPSANGDFAVFLPAGSYSVGIKGTKWLRTTATVNTTNGNQTGVNVVLLPGDANDDNLVDIVDLLLLIRHYNQVSPNPGYLESADFNADGTNDIADLLLLIGNYNQIGDP